LVPINDNRSVLTMRRFSPFLIGNCRRREYLQSAITKESAGNVDRCSRSWSRKRKRLHAQRLSASPIQSSRMRTTPSSLAFLHYIRRSSRYSGRGCDYSVSTVWGVYDRINYLLDVVRLRLNYPQLRRLVKEHKEKHSAETCLN
jgi:hypothetical protein